MTYMGWRLMSGGESKRESVFLRRGDIVKLKSGTSPQRVLRVKADIPAALLEYVSDPGGDKFGHCWRRVEELELIEFDIDEKECDMSGKSTTTLYQTRAEPVRYGTFLTKNSKGQLVLEMKGSSGAVEAFDPDQVEEVIPYTVSVLDLVHGEVHFETTKGSVQVGDVILSESGHLVKVNALDTKQKGAQKLKGRKLVTVPLPD